MTYTREQFDNEADLANKLDFVYNMFYEADFSVAEKVCNGIGPSWFPERLRKLVSGLNPSLVPVADNHDLGYYYGTGTTSDFRRCNDAFAVNGEKVAKAKYKWYDPRRYWVIFQANKFAKECDIAGWPAYVAAIKERKRDFVENGATETDKEIEEAGNAD